jgi:hypothetical protein
LSTRCAFDQQTIDSFESDSGVQIRLNKEQRMQLMKESKVNLLVAQMSEAVHQLCADSHELFRYVESQAKQFQPISMSLFVINDDTWKLMEGKPVHSDRMLPMITIPWFFWLPSEITKTNLVGVRRSPAESTSFYLDERNYQITLDGQGGDFCGLLEGRLVHKAAGMRPILVPGTPGIRVKTPHYESSKLRMTIVTRESECHLYPLPEKRLDYTFSESPRTFYEHGVRIDTDGGNVLLKVGKGAELPLRGDTKIYVGRAFAESSSSTNTLAFHVWLTALSESIELMGGGPRPVRSY